MKNTIEDKFNDESDVIEHKNLGFFKSEQRILKNTIKDKCNDESEVTEQKNLGFFKVDKEKS